MKYEADLETRWHEPLEIPRREIVLPIPRRWFDFINLRGVDVVATIANLVTFDGAERLERAKPQPNFAGIWRGVMAEMVIPPAAPGDLVKSSVVLREDVLECAVIAARAAGCTVHELLLKIIGRVMPPAPGTRPRKRVPRGSAGMEVAAAGNVVCGPWGN